VNASNNANEIKPLYAHLFKERVIFDLGFWLIDVEVTSYVNQF
jgi:hypothetical protein